MDDDMTREHWLSLGLQENALPVFEAGDLRTVEAANSRVVGILKHGAGHWINSCAMVAAWFITPARRS